MPWYRLHGTCIKAKPGHQQHRRGCTHPAGHTSRLKPRQRLSRWPIKDTFLSKVVSVLGSDRMANGLSFTEVQPLVLVSMYPDTFLYCQWQISLLPQLVTDLVKPGLVSFEVSRKNRVGQTIKSTSYSLASFRCQIILTQCNLKSSTLTSPTPSAAWIYSLEFASCSPSSGSKKQLPTSWEYLPWNLNYCAKLLLSSLRFVFAKEICPTTTQREEKKEEKGALYNRINRVVAMVMWS